MFCDGTHLAQLGPPLGGVMDKRQSGFTLIEIAIVLVIIGLLLGGVLKGQELITSARVRNLISLQDGIKAAYFGFLDRYRALPGDYAQATTNITGVNGACGVANAGNGNGDGQIAVAAASGTASPSENILAWEHLSKSGFINGSYTCATTASPTSAPTNPYGQYLDLVYDAGYAINPAGTPPTRHLLKTGGNIASDLLAEIDRKVDDGNPTGGSYRAQTTGTVATTGCFTIPASGTPAWTTGSPAPNCGGVSLY
jgi:prepilin-type N-terminal cleavage/methylation domain-containing protein